MIALSFLLLLTSIGNGAANCSDQVTVVTGVLLPQKPIATLIGRRRVLIVSGPSASGAGFKAQIQAITEWRKEAVERDVSAVAVIGDHTVGGASDSAGALRRAYRLPKDKFTVVLIGKDGREALRSLTPLSSNQLQAAIDAMPMRRAGLR